jgi:hypothetical protein
MNIATKWSIVCKQRGGIKVKNPAVFAENRQKRAAPVGSSF